MPKLIYIVDDEEDIVELIALHLKKNGFAHKSFYDTSSLFKAIKATLPDLIILDIMLPDMDGMEACKLLKKDDRSAAVPIIMLTARTDETDKILGLELGADDYITKPFSPKELIARIKVVLRRNLRPVETPAAKNDIITIDSDKFTVTIRGKKIDLTTTEFKILELLSSKKGYVFSREKILDYLWGEDKIVIDRTIDVHIRNLREKMGKDGALIKNIRGVGYKMEE
jgi:two-component system phosphate regulon response regulator PhoB/two-component system alkaline phosphatase synthesis response regulator PhoP